MKKVVLIIILLFTLSCHKKADRNLTYTNVVRNENVIHLRSNFILQNTQTLNFIDTFLVRCQKPDIAIDPDINKCFFLLFIYQNDFFTRLKISYSPTGSNLDEIISLGTGYFIYKGQVFIIITGLDRLCESNSSLLMELQNNYGNEAIKNDWQLMKSNKNIEFKPTITWEADLIGDTLMIRGGTISPLDPPPADTTILFQYIRSIKSFNPLVDWSTINNQKF